MRSHRETVTLALRSEGHQQGSREDYVRPDRMERRKHLRSLRKQRTVGFCHQWGFQAEAEWRGISMLLQAAPTELAAGLNLGDKRQVWKHTHQVIINRLILGSM